MFGSAFTFIPTNSFSRKDLNYEEGEFLNIHYGDIHTEFNKIFDCEKERVPFVNKEIRISSKMYDRVCNEGDLIFVDAAEDYEGVGKMIEVVNTNNQKILSGSHTLHARPVSKLFSKFYLELLQFQ